MLKLINKIVKDIEVELLKATAIQSDYVSRVCSVCSYPCCSRVGYLYGEKDILFQQLSGKKPKRKRKSPRKKGCRFLGPGGCLLDILSRPFICIRYLCTELKKAIDKDNPEILGSLEKRFIQIEEMRSRMWSVYLDHLMNEGGQGRL